MQKLIFINFIKKKLSPTLTILLLVLLVNNDLKASVDSLNSNQKSSNISEQINDAFTPFVKVLSKILFWDPFTATGIYDPYVYQNGKAVVNKNGEFVTAPLKLIVVWLMCAALFFTFYFRFISFRGFRHSLGLISGKYSDRKHKGEVTHFQALSTALSATVGMGNIAGVAIGISIGGPGATFWMIIAGLLGMSSKFIECTLGVKYRQIDEKGKVSGGAMYYLKYGLKKRNLGVLGSFLAIMFSILVVGGSVGGGNMLQANQSFSQFALIFPAAQPYGFLYGIVMAVLVGLVIIGGIKSIAKVTSRIVPFMAVFYVITALIIIFINWRFLNDAFLLIIKGAFCADALKGGFIGVLIMGFQRGTFSNEAGVGSASIAHSAAKTEIPVREGIVALVEPFVDTVVICTMTALVLIFTGFYQNPDNLQGVQLTSAAFASVFPWFPYLLLIAVLLFAYSTMISWSYYGLKGFDFLFGNLSKKYFGSRRVADVVFQVFYLLCIIIGSSSSVYAVMDFSDMMVLCMAFPNVVGLAILAPEVKNELRDYWKRYKEGEFSIS